MSKIMSKINLILPKVLTMKSPERSTSSAAAAEELNTRRAQLLSSIKTFIVILSSSIILLIAFRNTLTWYWTTRNLVFSTWANTPVLHWQSGTSSAFGARPATSGKAVGTMCWTCSTTTNSISASTAPFWSHSRFTGWSAPSTRLLT